MTHEQKPESAEFRTREEQVESFFRSQGWPEYIKLSAHEMDFAFIEAEARGAAEQRRKDAEGAELQTCANCGGSGEEPGAYYSDGSPYSCSVCEGSGTVYTRPANVAALEARVKELEGVNKSWSDAAANALTCLENGRQANARDELKAAQRHAAAIREGGE